MSHHGNPSVLHTCRCFVFIPVVAVRFGLAAFPLFLALCLPTVGQSDESVREVLQKIGVKKGICVVAGNASDALPLELARASELLIYVQFDEEAKAESLRRAAEAAGLLGTRVYVEKGGLGRLHLAENLADAVLAGAGARREEVLRVLRPGGKALLGGETLTKPFPEGADEWTHPFHGPDNNPLSEDSLARGPFLTQFMAEPWYATVPCFSVFSGGRIFKVFGERAYTQATWENLDSLVALNAWNGTLLWKKKLPETFMIHRNTLVATPEALYLGDDQSCKVYDAETGEIRDEIVIPEGLADGPVWKWMALEDGVLYALVGEKEPSVEVLRGERFRNGGWSHWQIRDYKFGFGRTVLALDPKTKKVLWQHRDEHAIDGRAMCMAAGRIFLYSDQTSLAALDAKTGQIQWRTTDAKLLAAIGPHGPAQHPHLGFTATPYAKCSDQAVYFAGPTRSRFVAVAAEDGKLLWEYDGGNFQLVIRPDALYALGLVYPPTRQEGHSMKLDPLTGDVLARFGSRTGCTRATGCGDSIFVRGGMGSTTVWDIRGERPRRGLISPMRPACQDGVIAANGRLYWGPWICRCSTTQIGVISLAPAGDFDYAPRADEAERLEAAAEPGSVAEPPVTDRDWPTYRRDNERSGRSPVMVPKEVVERWTFSPSAVNVATAPIAVAGSVFLAGSDGIVRAVAASTGKAIWTAATGGWVKFPPAFWRGRLYVGSCDGWVYCLDADSGRRLWRFRAAPVERKILVYGSLMSTWPVGSGVLVHDGVAYAAAGMANYDGTHVFALDAVSGKIRWQNSTSGHQIARPDSGAGVQGHLLLHGSALYMPAGHLAPIARYEIADGKFSRYGNAHRDLVVGKDLGLIDGEVRAIGHPLYWRQLDSHHIGQDPIRQAGWQPIDIAARFAARDGHIAVAGNKVGLAESKPDSRGQPVFRWSRTTFQEYAAVAFAENAILVAGVNWIGHGPEARADGGIAALDIVDGRVIWQRPLPAAPVMFGVAIDREGQVLVSLQGGRLICLGAARQ